MLVTIVRRWRVLIGDKSAMELHELHRRHIGG